MVVEGKLLGISNLPVDVCAGGQLAGDGKHVIADIGGDDPGIGEGLLQMACNAASAAGYFQDGLWLRHAGSCVFYEMPGI